MNDPMSADLDVLVIGDLNPDLILSGDGITPRFGQAETLVDDGAFTLGGSGAITACGLAKLGLRTGMLALVGDDDLGRVSIAQLQQYGVDTAHVVVDSACSTGISVHLVEDDDRAILTYAGSLAALSSSHISPSVFAGVRHVHVAGVFLLTGLRSELADLLAIARAAGCSISMDTNWDPTEAWHAEDLLAQCDYLLPNEEEARALAGEAGIDGLEAAIDYLSSLVGTVVIKRGRSGALVVRGPQRWSRLAADVEVVDAIGAGDSFNAGFIAGVLTGQDEADSLALGLAVGTLSVGGRGGTAAQPTMDQVQAFQESGRQAEANGEE